MDSVRVPNEILIPEVGELLKEGMEVILMTRGSSMLPFIRGEKDSVRLKLRESVRERDVVLAQISRGRYVIHRVIAVNGDVLTLKGDGNLRGTETCSLSDVLGTVEAVIGPDGKERPLREGRIWTRLGPLKRYILAIYRRII